MTKLELLDLLRDVPDDAEVLCAGGPTEGIAYSASSNEVVLNQEAEFDQRYECERCGRVSLLPQCRCDQGPVDRMAVGDDAREKQMNTPRYATEQEQAEQLKRIGEQAIRLFTKDAATPAQP